MESDLRPDIDSIIDTAWEDDEPRREEFTAGEAEEGQRLDRALTLLLPDLSRSYLQSLVDDGYVTVSDRTRKVSYRLRAGESIVVLVPPPVPIEPIAEAIPLDIVYEDADVIVINKPAGMVAHPSPGHDRGTVVNAVLGHAPEVQINGSIRPGIVHRLDKDTSGLLIVAKNERAMAVLSAQFQERRAIKRYLALLDGEVDPDEGTIDVPIARDPRARQRMAAVRGGRAAVSHFRALERFIGYTLVEVRIETGRTHQIRVHCAFIDHPVTGDTVYGRQKRPADLPLDRQFLHATALSLTLPDGTWHDFASPLPDDLEATLATLREQFSAPVVSDIIKAS